MDLYREVNKFANVLKSLGVKKRTPVTIWMPMIPETAVVALSCQRIEAWHSIVYTAFALISWILLCDHLLLFTSTKGGNPFSLMILRKNQHKISPYGEG